MEIGTVMPGSFVGPNRDGLIPVRMCIVMVSGPTDLHTVQLIGPLDHSPAVGSKILIIPVEDSWELGIEIEEVAAMLATAIGEKVFAAYTAPGVPSPTARIRLNPITGQVILAEGLAGTAVEFTRLKAAFDAFIIEYNSHVHATAGVGTPSAPSVPSTANIDAAQSPLVGVP